MISLLKPFGSLLCCFFISSLILAQPGTLDESFVPETGADNIVTSSAVLDDGKIIIGGFFTSYNGTARGRIARLNTDGSLDETFDPGTGTDEKVRTISIQSDGKIIIGGDFKSYNGTAIDNIARLNTDGTLDGSFVVGTTWNIFASAIQSDGKIIIGGQFTSYAGVERNRIARLNTDGTLDESFDVGTGAGFIVETIAIQSNGKIIIGGHFTTYNGNQRNGIARLNSDGTLDESFVVGDGATGIITSIAIQSDDKIIIGGNFGHYNGSSSPGIARLNTDGTLDESFTVGNGANNFVNTITIQNDGKLIICGQFTTYNDNGRNYIARLNADGTLDETFYVGTGADNIVSTTAIQGDDKIFIGGHFQNYSDTAINYVASLIGGECNDSYIPDVPGSLEGSTAVCSSSELTYSITEISRATSYTWTLPDGWSGSSTTNSINATSGATSGTITVTADNVCGSSDSQTIEITVDTTIPVQPESITGPMEICENTSGTYSIDEASGASSYTWTLPDGWTGSSSTNSIEVTAQTNGGDISVIANNACGSSNERVISISVDSAIPEIPESINGPTKVCNKSTETYTITEVNGASSYTWTLPDGWSGSSSTNSIEATVEATGGTISVNADNSCGSSSSQTLTVTTTVIDNSVSTNENAITANASDAIYQWLDCDNDFTAINGETSQSYLAMSTGSYAVMITKDGCSTTSDCQQIVITGITSLSESLSIYPNPFSTQLSIENEWGKMPIKFEIFNLMGTCVFEGKIKEKTSLDVDNFVSGLYIIHLENGEMYKVLKSK